MSRLLFYLFIKPLSLLPLSVLYVLSSMVYFVLYRLVGYRKKVVTTNLKNAFPDKSAKEIAAIRKRFYQFICDFVVEVIKLFSISKKEALGRCVYRNTEVFDPFFKEGKSVLVVKGHYSSWEFFLQTLDLHIPHQGVLIYNPLTNSFFNKEFKKFRKKFGQVMVPVNDTRDYLEDNNDKLIAPIFGTDQSPTFNKSVYWTQFLNQETAVAYGTEYFAKKYDMPVIFAAMTPKRRGYFVVDFEVLEANPTQSAPNEITEKHVRAMEQHILKQPEYWLWSHRRWKRKKEV